MKRNHEIVGYNIWKSMLLALNPAIFEEISCRTIFYAYCIYFMNHLPKSKKENFTCQFMSVVPHILPHILFSFGKGFLESIINYIIYLLLYIVVLGLVFGILKEKRDVLSTMIAHVWQIQLDLLFLDCHIRLIEEEQQNARLSIAIYRVIVKLRLCWKKLYLRNRQIIYILILWNKQLELMISLIM